MQIISLFFKNIKNSLYRNKQQRIKIEELMTQQFCFHVYYPKTTKKMMYERTGIPIGIHQWDYDV